MKVILIAAIAPGGVIGRSRKPCPRHVTEAMRGGTCGACDGSGTVACNDLPWGRAYPEDLARFQRVTMGHAVIMGRRTMESMGKAWPLKGRTSYVVSTGLLKPENRDAREQVLARGSSIAGGLSGALHAASDHETAFIIGGAGIFRDALPIADELDLTLISREWEGDVLFPYGDAFAHPDIEVGDTVYPGARESIGMLSEKLGFRCVSRTPGEHPDLTHTRWVRR